MRIIRSGPAVTALAISVVLGACAPGRRPAGAEPAAEAATEQNAAAPASAEPAFPLHTQGRFIVDATGRRVRLMAVNWYGAESEDFVVGGLNLQSLDTIAVMIRALGFNAVRLPWSNELVERDPIVPRRALTANPTLQGHHALDVLDRTVAALTSRRLMVVLDNHNSDAEWCCGNDGNELWYNERYPESSWVADWRAMATRYRDDPYVVGADLRNEPRGRATWGGPPETDWHAAAERGGDAVVDIDPDLLVFVEGTAYASNLSGLDTLPVRLGVADRVVYEAHDYAWFESHAGYQDWLERVTPKWGYLVTGPLPRPLWIGEFGTCYRSVACVRSEDPKQLGSWFAALTRWIGEHQVDWAYWGLNGTQSTGKGRTFGAVEGYGVLNPTWSGISSPTHMAALRAILERHPGG